MIFNKQVQKLVLLKNGVQKKNFNSLQIKAQKIADSLKRSSYQFVKLYQIDLCSMIKVSSNVTAVEQENYDVKLNEVNILNVKVNSTQQRLAVINTKLNNIGNIFIYLFYSLCNIKIILIEKTLNYYKIKLKNHNITIYTYNRARIKLDSTYVMTKIYGVISCGTIFL